MMGHDSRNTYNLTSSSANVFNELSEPDALKKMSRKLHNTKLSPRLLPTKRRNKYIA